MEKAFLCPKCGASLILQEGSDPVCCFCSAALEEKDEIANPKGGFYIGSMGRKNLRKSTCSRCGKSMFTVLSGKVEPSRCMSCGSDDLVSSSASEMFPSKIVRAPFSCDRKEAEEEYLKCVKKEKMKFHGCSGRTYLDSITPAYVPFIFYDYHIIGRGILSVVPHVKVPRNMGDKIVGVLILNDFTLERSSSAVQPYPKTIASEMAWQSLPESACDAVSRKKTDETLIMLKGGAGSEDSSIDDMEDAVILGVDRSAKEIEDDFLKRIKDFIKECIITENLSNFTITSYVDDTEYEPALGQLIYVPMWILKIRKKDQCLTWYMNGISGRCSDLSWESVEKAAPVQEQKTIETMKKKKIKSFTAEDFGPADRPVNFRTYMIDTVASTIVAEMTLNEMSADKELLQLEKTMRRERKVVSVPTISEAYQADVEEAVSKSRQNPIPSAPVPLPTEHSPLFLMREEARNRSLGRGRALPQKPIDRKVGNEEQFEREEIPSSYAVEMGLADMPEYDPDGPNPFKR